MASSRLSRRSLTVSKPLSRDLFDPVRNRFVARTPEEEVRQNLLKMMIESLGFPRSLLAVEKTLSQMPHLQVVAGLPERRADIVCFARGIHAEHELYPLLLIECKEGSIDRSAIEQAIGYNAWVGAYFVALAGLEELQLFSRSMDQALPLPCHRLPSYAQLLKSLS